MRSILCILPLACRSVLGQIYVADWHTGAYDGTIASYSLSGALINPSLVTGLCKPDDVLTDGLGHLFAVNTDGINRGVGEFTMSGAPINPHLCPASSAYGAVVGPNGHIYMTTWSDGTVSEYSATGTLLNPSFITGLNYPTDITFDSLGRFLVACQGTSSAAGAGYVGCYTAAGTAVNTHFISGLSDPAGLAVDAAGNIYVANYENGVFGNNDTVGKYSASGQVINASLITGLDTPTAVAVDNLGHLFVTESRPHRVGEYTTSGATINASFITSVQNPLSIIVIVPEPSIGLFAIACLGVLAARRRQLQNGRIDRTIWFSKFLPRQTEQSH